MRHLLLLLPYFYLCFLSRADDTPEVFEQGDRLSEETGADFWRRANTVTDSQEEPLTLRGRRLATTFVRDLRELPNLRMSKSVWATCVDAILDADESLMATIKRRAIIVSRINTVRDGKRWWARVALSELTYAGMDKSSGSTLNYGILSSAEQPRLQSTTPKANTPAWALDIDVDSLDWAAVKIALPSQTDLRTETTPDVRMQGSCGSCWAWTAVGLVQETLARQAGVDAELGVQPLLDCLGPSSRLCAADAEATCRLRGCLGGDIASALEAILQLGGLPAAPDYPYICTDKEWCQVRQGESEHCAPFQPFVSSFKWGRFALTEPQMMYYMQGRPIATLVAPDSSPESVFRLYAGGYFDHCEHPAYGLSHSVLLMGYGTIPSEDGTPLPYWLLKNSWGRDWGENGYMRLERGVNMCGVETDGQQYLVGEIQTSRKELPIPPSSGVLAYYADGCNLDRDCDYRSSEDDTWRVCFCIGRSCHHQGESVDGARLGPDHSVHAGCYLDWLSNSCRCKTDQLAKDIELDGALVNMTCTPEYCGSDISNVYYAAAFQGRPDVPLALSVCFVSLGALL
eukprot:TRINITY_DN42974_c0_g1_i2.p1 TRINITY_DN42974_c0_g1~~TRINITY_DN42974_c0_g1_i2.p1  ORF type:complete len:571 (+),score=58.17 TRINITY_DN42974_c0_g1_i2:76-1788(+)